MTMAFSSACRGVAPRTTYTVLVLVVVFLFLKVILGKSLLNLSSSCSK